MFGQFSWEDKTDSSLDFATGDGGFAVVGNQFAGFGGNFTKDVVDEGVHDGHTFLGHTSVGVDLFQYLVNVNSEGFYSSLFSFTGCFLGSFFGHIDKIEISCKKEGEGQREKEGKKVSWMASKRADVDICSNRGWSVARPKYFISA